MVHDTENEWQLAPGVVAHPKGALGFIYLITTESGRFYVGQRVYKRKVTRYKTTNGVKRKLRGQYDVASWKRYVGSCNELKAHISDSEAFTKVILMNCTSKSEMNYAELACQIACHAIVSERGYNSGIMARQGKIKQSENFLIDLERAMAFTAKTVAQLATDNA